MNKFTEGPWEIGRTIITRYTCGWSKEQIEANNEAESQMVFARFTAEDEGRSRILIAGNTAQLSVEENQANAHLIAAAPDMYAAIQDALDDYEEGEPIREYELRNALIKARGAYDEM